MWLNFEIHVPWHKHCKGVFFSLSLFDLLFNFLSCPKALFYCLPLWSKLARWDDIHFRNNLTKILTEASVLVSFLLPFCFVLLQALSLSSALCCPASPQGFTFYLLLIRLTPDHSGREKESWWRNNGKEKSKIPEQCVWVTIFFSLYLSTHYFASLTLGGGSWKLYRSLFPLEYSTSWGEKKQQQLKIG